MEVILRNMLVLSIFLNYGKFKRVEIQEACQISSKFIEIACIDNLDGRRVRFKTLFSKELMNKLKGSCYTCLRHKE